MNSYEEETLQTRGPKHQKHSISVEAHKNQLGKGLCTAGTRTKEKGRHRLYIHEDNRGQLETIRNQGPHRGR